MYTILVSLLAIAGTCVAIAGAIALCSLVAYMLAGMCGVDEDLQRYFRAKVAAWIAKQEGKTNA